MIVPATIASKLSLRTSRFVEPERFLHRLRDVVLESGVDLCRVVVAAFPEPGAGKARHDRQRVVRHRREVLDAADVGHVRVGRTAAVVTTPAVGTRGGRRRLRTAGVVVIVVPATCGETERQGYDTEQSKHLAHWQSSPGKI